MIFDSKTYRITKPDTFYKVSMSIGIIALLLSASGYFLNPGQFFHSYLTSLMFWTTLGLGGLFFTMLHHLTGSVWSTVYRRISETIMKVLPLLFIFFLPIAIWGLHELYHWSHSEIVANDPLLNKKSGYLNTPFFIGRTIGYFLIWYFFAKKLYNLSISQDLNFSQRNTSHMLRYSAVGMIIFALTISFASFDWMMSTDAHWYSTIFGVYIFTGSYLLIIVFLILFSHTIQKVGILNDKITVEHYHDLGKLLFAFVVFWAYIAGSQYFFIWYANIPEETVWYLHRWSGSWKSLSLVLIFGHFFIPFVILIFRWTKRNLPVLKLIAVWVLFMHYIDIYWIIMPNFHHHDFHFSWMDLSTFIAIGGVFLGLFWKRLKTQALVPVSDPALQKSFDFVNV